MKISISILICLIIVNVYNTESLYKNKGRDWPGLCSTGANQSPINIIEGSNTQESGMCFIN